MGKVFVDGLKLYYYYCYLYKKSYVLYLFQIIYFLILRYESLNYYFSLNYMEKGKIWEMTFYLIKLYKNLIFSKRY